MDLGPRFRSSYSSGQSFIIAAINFVIHGRTLDSFKLNLKILHIEKEEIDCLNDSEVLYIVKSK